MEEGVARSNSERVAYCPVEPVLNCLSAGHVGPVWGSPTGPLLSANGPSLLSPFSPSPFQKPNSLSRRDEREREVRRRAWRSSET